ncbi:MAG TPA: GyrI-like domain-containing protein [Flavobacteriaceae bacterium]|nr:GyrI-like domain-containing protein [Flavobacteriaceae bacterium]
MKLLKYFLLLILIILVGGAAYVALIDGKFTYNENVELKAPRDLVFQEINNLKNWESWSDFKNNDMQLHYSEKTTGDDAFFTWKNKESNIAGDLINTKVERSSLIEQKGNFEERIGSTSYRTKWDFNKEGDTTYVYLEINGKLDFKAKAFRLFKGDSAQKHFDSRIQKNLNRLKEEVIKKMEVYSINVDGVKTTAGRDYVYTSQSLKNEPESIAKNRLEQTEKLHSFLENQSRKAKGSPFMIYNTIDRAHQNVIVSFALPIQIDKDIELEDTEKNILMGTQESQRVIKGTLKGNYQNIPKLWEAINTYLKNNQLEQDSQAKAYEVYKVTRQETENPAEWITELYVPIKKRKEEPALPTDLDL